MVGGAKIAILSIDWSVVNIGNQLQRVTSGIRKSIFICRLKSQGSEERKCSVCNSIGGNINNTGSEINRNEIFSKLLLKYFHPETEAEPESKPDKIRYSKSNEMMVDRMAAILLRCSRTGH